VICVPVSCETVHPRHSQKRVCDALCCCAVFVICVPVGCETVHPRHSQKRVCDASRCCAAPFAHEAALPS